MVEYLRTIEKLAKLRRSVSCIHFAIEGFNYKGKVLNVNNLKGAL